MTITVGVAWGEMSALMAYIKQSFQKFFILLFVRIPSPHQESHVQIFSESTGDDELLLSSCSQAAQTRARLTIIVCLIYRKIYP